MNPCWQRDGGIYISVWMRRELQLRYRREPSLTSDLWPYPIIKGVCGDLCGSDEHQVRLKLLQMLCQVFYSMCPCVVSLIICVFCTVISCACHNISILTLNTICHKRVVSVIVPVTQNQNIRTKTIKFKTSKLNCITTSLSQLRIAQTLNSGYIKLI